MKKLAIDEGDAYPGETPQAQADAINSDQHDWNPVKSYNWVYSNGQLHISPDHEHSELFEHSGIEPDHSGPMALGHVTVDSGKATWEVETNLHAKGILRILKDWSDGHGWIWGGLTDMQGEPISEAPEYNPKKADWQDSPSIPTYTDPLTLTSRAGGSNDASWATNSQGEPWIVKPYYGDSNRVATELLSNSVYRHMGANVPAMGMYNHQGNPAVAYPAAQGDVRPYWSQSQGPHPEIGKHFMTDALLGNRDYLGLEDDNILWQGHHPMRLDQGGTLEYRAMGEPKEYGPVPEEVSSMMKPGRQGARGAQVDGNGMRQQAGDISNRLTPDVVNGMVDSAPFSDENMRERIRQNLNARVNWMGQYGGQRQAGNDNVLKTIEDLEEKNIYSPEWNDEEDHHLFQDPPDERKPEGVFQCPSCHRSFPDWDQYMTHRRSEDPHSEPIDDGKFPEIEMNPIQDSHFSPTPKFYEAAIPQGRDMVEAPIPFLFDIEHDKIIVGNPGQDMGGVGGFTPGGQVVGRYEPGGKIVISSSTNMPFSIYHMIQLWYSSYPHMEVKSVYMEDGQGKSQKMASDQPQDVGQYVAAMAAADPTVWKVVQALKKAGGHPYVVGGAVRDAFMGKAPKDVDLMVTGLQAEDVRQALKNVPGQTNLTGKDFGVFRHRENPQDEDVEIALPRRERSTGTGHKDFDVQVDPSMTPEEDLYRRDFTMNAMAVDLNNNRILDPFNGAKDIKDGVIRTLNTKSLSDDPLRIVRALVAAARYGFHPDENTLQQMEQNAPAIAHLPPDRIQPELDKLFKGSLPGDGLRLAQQTGALKKILPELDRTFGHSQNNPHHEMNLYDHMLNVGDRLSTITDDPDLRMAGYLHDVGKKDSHWTECKDCGNKVNGPVDTCPDCGSNNTSGHFYYSGEHDDNGNPIGADHETVGAEQNAARMRALRYPNARADRVRNLTAFHMYPSFTSEKGARRFIRNVGDNADDLLKLRWADQGGKSVYPTDPSKSTEQEQALIDQVRQNQQPTGVSSLALNGNDLIQNGWKPGAQMGQILNGLTDKIVDDPSLNNKETLLGIARDTWPPQ